MIQVTADRNRPIALSDARSRVDAAVADLPEEPRGSFEGRGIVVCAGGARYFVNAWVLINMLREVGCTLPIQLWHIGERELRPWQRRILRPFDVEFVDALQVAERYPIRRLHGWALKPYSLLHCRFRETILLDADNVPIRDPSCLFDTREYQESGAIFWPDFHTMAKDRPIWELVGLAPREEPEFESGQIVLDKERCWKALELTVWFNEHSDFWYNHIYGDKDTFHLAWRRLGLEYAMPAHPIHALEGTMCQHDFEGRRLFQHRNTQKWDLVGNRRVDGFQHEARCIDFIDALRPYARLLQGLPSFDLTLAVLVAPRLYRYVREGHDERPLELLDGGLVGEGAAGMERLWTIFSDGEDIHLQLHGDEGLTATLRPTGDGAFKVWRGAWTRHERMPVRLERM